VEILRGDSLYRVLLRRYSKDPQGWSFTISPSMKDGFFDALVGGPDESWHLKLDTIYKPSPFVLGARTPPDSSEPPASVLPFGFRRVDPLEAPIPLDGSQERMSALLAYLSTVSPVVPTAPGSYIQGPYLFTERGWPAESMSRDRRIVDERLSDEMRRLLRTKYSSYL
jgi:hypothetical protein